MGVQRALKKHQRKLAAISNVTGLGIGEKDGKQVILIFIKKGTVIPTNKIPKKIEGYETEIREEIKVG
jgi:hypothetical protein